MRAICSSALAAAFLVTAAPAPAQSPPQQPQQPVLQPQEQQQPQVEERPNRIQIEYGTPRTPTHATIADTLRNNRVLEQVQEIFSPLKLPIDLTVKTMSCGVENAWYQRPVITICYEYIASDILQHVPKETTRSGVTPEDAMIGPLFYTVAHEMGHAVFDLMSVPLFGRAEDAADQFAAYVMLCIGRDKARRLIGGAAYSYARYFESPKITTRVTAFADVHSAPMQRFYNLLCIAYGADPVQFGYAVKQGDLPADRARGCKIEYEEVNFAFQQLIFPKLDRDLVNKVQMIYWFKNIAPMPEEQQPRTAMRWWKRWTTRQ